MSIYVKMHDTFMSGWGPASNKANIFAVECDTQAQADLIIRAAGDRDEMTNIKQVSCMPRSTSQRLVSLRSFSSLGSIWTGVHDYECYQCGKQVMWLDPESRCGDCSRMTPEEIRGE